MITVQTGTETPQQEDQSYIDQMVAKADGLNAEPQQPQEQLYAGKYKSVEELEKGYQELQKAYSSKSNKATPTETPATNDSLTIDDTQAQETIEGLGLDFDSLSTQFYETGELDPSARERLNKAGIPDAIIDGYLEGQQIKLTQMTTRVFDTAGGQEEYSKLTQWAAKNLSKAEVNAYNDVINSGDIEKIVIATRGLKSTYEDKFGRTPSLISGDTSGSLNNSAYASMAQVKAAMADPRYSKDPAYRNEVIDKISRSNVF